MSEQKQVDINIEEGAEELPHDGLLSNAVYGMAKAVEAASQGHGRLALFWAASGVELLGLAMVRAKRDGDEQ